MNQQAKEFLENYQLKLTNFERILPRFLKADYFPTLMEGMQYSLFAGGKRIRPIMLFETARMHDVSQDKVENFAVALEMIHTYSLIHDDLPSMDNDDLRRGKETNHVVFGEGNAILAGDGLLSLAYEVMLDGVKLSGKSGIKAMEYIAKKAGPNGMLSGQSADLYFEKVEKRELKDLEYIHKRKTGGLIQAAMVAGGILSGVDENVVDTLEKFGESYGVLFQITDDILDVVGTKEVLGKSVGKDAGKNKFTFVSFLGLDESRKLAKEKAEQCREVLSTIKGKKGFFNDLVSYTLERES